MQGWLIALTALLYLALLFAVAAYGDRRALVRKDQARPMVYALSAAVYCTSWTFFGSVGVASDRGFEYFGIFVGPILLFTIGMPLVRKIVRLSKAERITSIADFLAARYGKNARVAALAALIAIIGTVPYIALQLKAISDAVTLMVTSYSPASNDIIYSFDVALIVALTMIAFAVLFGTRHADATEHQDGLMLAIALESMIKIGAFLFVAIGITFFLFDGFGPIVDAFSTSTQIKEAMTAGSSPARWIVLTLLSAAAVLVLPRQFHVIVVENRSESELNRAAWVFPLYLIAINALVMPIAIAGMLYVKDGTPADLYLLALPILAGHDWLALMTFIGGLSAATAMVIVATVALSIMISNNIVIPFLLWRFASVIRTTGGNWSSMILNTRRVSIAIVIFAAFAYYQQTTETARLASIGLLAFAAIAQFTPALLIGLFWRNANARGAFWGMLGGFLVWAYTLLVPSLAAEPYAWIVDGPFGITALQPQALFGSGGDALTHGVFWSLLANVILVIFGSLSRNATPLERIQAQTFVPRRPLGDPGLKRFSTNITVAELKETVGRYVGDERMERAFSTFEVSESRTLNNYVTADVELVRYAEQILASAVGTSSARLVLGLLLEKDGASRQDTVRLLDDASEALQQNRDLLQLALSQMDQGISVFDRDYRLTNWNGQFRRLMDLPAQFGQFGMPLKDITNALWLSEQITEDSRDQLLDWISQGKGVQQLHLERSGRILEVRSNPMPDGGLVVTYTDITGRVESDEALQRANESLEQRVEMRTAELTTVNEELAQARQDADAANIGKTRFLASAGHDISQPLNAARIYTSSLIERTANSKHDHHDISLKIDTALGSVEAIIGAVLDISRLDAGALTPAPSAFKVNEILDRLRNDFTPAAQEKNLELKVINSNAIVHTDRALLMRLAQNLVSNAIKYTNEGRVLVGVRKSGPDLLLCVYDTGIGINDNDLSKVFGEFERLKEGATIAGGLGLGLSIVDRISKVLSSDVKVRSHPGVGTAFTVSMSPADSAMMPVAEKSAPNKQSRDLLNGMKIYCIDNEPTIVEGMQVLLGGWGADVDIATDRDGLLSLMSAATPDVIIADYHLDDGDDGLAVIKAARDVSGNQITAILITADRSAAIRQRADDADVMLLNKPIKPAALRALLHGLPTLQIEAAE